MKPKAQNPNEVGLLEYLEDIIGSNKYVEEIETIERELETLREEKIEKTNRLRNAQRHLETLESGKNEALKIHLKRKRKVSIKKSQLLYRDVRVC